MLVSAADARALGIHILKGCGIPELHACTQIDLLLDAELSGRASHGLLRLNRIVERIRNGVTSPTATGRHEWRGQACLEVDGEMGLGPVVALEALRRIVDCASRTGVALAAVRNNNHLGMLAWYVERVASEGHVCIAMTTSEALVHPWGGRRAMVGTNPLAVGVPAHPEPLVLDMATSVVSMGKIHDYAHRNQPIPPHWALDAAGNPTTDAVAAKAGAIAPFGDAKGYAMGLALEVLVSALSGAAIGTDVHGTLDSTAVCNKGDVFIVVHSMAMPDMVSRVTDYLDAVRACPPMAGMAAVTIPGDRSRAARAQRMKDGISIADTVWLQLQSLAEGVTTQ
jgi:LDH2 family malate/lactate/ureidoglycolate dehydrogenase